MFLSTVVPSTMLNVEKNLSLADSFFKLPYDFSFGRNIVLNINPKVGVMGSSRQLNEYDILANKNNNVLNRVIVNIPNDVNQFTVSHVFTATGLTANLSFYYRYNVEITCDMLENTITFKPLTLTTTNPNAEFDETYTAPTLITIYTIS